MADLLPDVAPLAGRVLEVARRGHFAYVEGAVGSGRNALLAVLGREPDAVVVELLSLQETDAPAVALLEAASFLEPSDRPRQTRGAETELHQVGKALAVGLREASKILVLRVPETWRAAEGAPSNDDAVPLRAAALLHGIFAQGAGIVLVADAAVTPERLGFHPQFRALLPAHRVPLDALRQFEWGAAYRTALDSLGRSVAAEFAQSPLAWRLGIGAIALGAPLGDVTSIIQSAVPIPPLTRLLSLQLRHVPQAAQAVARLLAVRRPLPTLAVPTVTGAQGDTVTLLTMCVGYGGEAVRVSPIVRRILSTRLRGHANDLEVTHKALSDEYEASDGASSPLSLDPTATRAWCEKVHHLAHAGEAGAAKWSEQELPSPEFYWDRGRRLSIVHRDYEQAAAVYRACTEVFPEDDYAWHYYGFNLQRSCGPSPRIEAAYQKAVDLAEENAWWNSRLITFFVSDGQPARSRREWMHAVERVDPDGTRVRSSPWLARHFHRWVCREWLRSGRVSWARDVLRLVPQQVRSQGAWRYLERQIRDGDAQWADFLASLEDRFEMSSVAADGIRECWSWLRSTAGEELPLPMAEPTADAERFQFAWSYRAMLLEVEVSPDGSVAWFGKDRLTKTTAGGTTTVGAIDPELLLGWLRKANDA